MRGYVINQYVHPKDLTLSLDAPEPTPGPGEVLIEVYSAGLNFFDVNISCAVEDVSHFGHIADFTIPREVSNPAAISFCSRHRAGWQDRK